MLLHGPNGAGKTNLLEALHVGTQGFSPRARRDAQMIRFGADAGRITLAGTRGDGAFETDVVLTRRESRRVALNGDRLVSVERLRQELTTLVFTPDRLAVVKGAPATRRAYLDRAAGRLFPARAHLPAEYSTAVGQRNAALRRLRMGQSTREALVPWTERTATLGAELVDAPHRRRRPSRGGVHGGRGRPRPRVGIRWCTKASRRPSPISTRASTPTSTVA